jgi:hypothetical protein
MKALFSIHDVMPDTLDLVREQLAMLTGQGHRQVCLLVVPGKDWSAEDLAQLQQWQAHGFELAAHGWHHHCQRFRGLYHRLHAALISRRCAEHLALAEGEVETLMRASRQWFVNQGLQAPSTYVPPAWALGRLPKARWQAIGFSRIEVLAGVLDVPHQRLLRMPLVGFEADVHWRAAFLRPFNAWQRHKAIRTGKPLRIGLHPYDHRLLLRDCLQQFLAQPWEGQAYHSV